MSTTSERRRRSWLARVAAACIVALLALALVEVALRAMGATDLVLYEQDAAAGFRLKPGQRVEPGGNTIVINDWGVRDKRQLAMKDKPRILVLGDSVTWGGIRLATEDLFPAVLEEALGGVEAVNAGVNGYSVAQMTALYRAHLKELEADLVVLCAIPGDFTRPATSRLTGGSLAYPLERPKVALFTAVEGARLLASQRWDWPWLKPAQAAAATDAVSEPERVRANTDALLALAEDLGPGRLHVVLTPWLPAEENEPLPEAVRVALAEQGIPLIDLNEAGEAGPEMFLDHIHLSAAGHAWVGERLAAPLSAALAAAEDGDTVDVAVETQEKVYDFVSPNNGSGPTWSQGCATVLRIGDEVVVSQMETGEDVPLLCNTRWRVLTRQEDGWRLFAEPDGYRQREPAVLARTSGDAFFLYVNDSVEPPGTKYGLCNPHLLKFDLGQPGEPVATIQPEWAGETYFTDHSYRGFASDRGRDELLMLNINAQTSVQHWCWLDGAGAVLGKGLLEFPIRACYPYTALKDRAAYVLAIGDIREPVEEWQQYKFEQTGRQWDYVFRILYFTWTDDISAKPFSEPIEIANRDATAGHVTPDSLWIAPDGAAYILYREREVQSALMRDRFFPDLSVEDALHLAVVRDGEVTERRVLVARGETPGRARLHELPDGRVFAVMYRGSPARNEVLQVYPEIGDAPVAVPFERPFSEFSLATVRAGNAPSNHVDLLGYAGGGGELTYGCFRLK